MKLASVLSVWVLWAAMGCQLVENPQEALKEKIQASSSSGEGLVTENPILSHGALSSMMGGNSYGYSAGRSSSGAYSYGQSSMYDVNSYANSYAYSYAYSSAWSSSSGIGYSSQNQSANWEMRADALDMWGSDFMSPGLSLFLPHSDAFEGGTSQVLDASGLCLSKCPEGDQWSIQGALTGSSVKTFLRLTQFTPSSKATWGEAYAGWVYFPKANANLTGETWFERSDPLGLSAGATIELDLRYSAGRKLQIQLFGAGIEPKDFAQSVPSYSYTGKGIRETIRVPLSMIKRASWSVPKSYDPAGIHAIGLYREVLAGAQGYAFPTNEVGITELEVFAIRIY
jgi:hypothetical protein